MLEPEETSIKCTERTLKSHEVVNEQLARQILKNWSAIAKAKVEEKGIIDRFKEFRSRVILTKSFLTWVEAAKINCSPTKLH